jgi:hypothetical protein
MIHKAHHRHALEETCRRVHDVEDDVDVPALDPPRFANRPDADDGAFAFLRHPGGKNPKPMLAQWDLEDDEELIHRGLCNYIETEPDDGEEPPADYDLQVMTCKDCNRTMTMEYWFRHHLYAGEDANPARIVPAGAIRVRKANTHGHPALAECAHWTPVGNFTAYPKAVYRQAEDVMTPALAYYLYLCVPHGEIVNHQAALRLYLHMSWVILEVTCLLCELVLGSEGKEETASAKKRNKPPKNTLACVELYMSYFAWRILCHNHVEMRRLDFDQWHRFYVWEAVNCTALFPERTLRGLIAERLQPTNMRLPSRQLVRKVGRSMMTMLENKLFFVAMVVMGLAVGPGVDEYFLPVRSLRSVEALLRRGAEPDLDSFVALVGVEALWFRVVDLSQDFGDPLLRRLKAFRSAWRQYEVQNIARRRGEKSVRSAGVEYKLARLLDPPRQAQLDAMDPQQLQATLKGPVCGRWASVLALRELGAFDFADPREAD